jgi:hypothetical protein
MDTTSHRHTVLVRVCLGLGTLLAIVAILAVWANRQLLNADRWAETSSAVLADPTVKAQVADYLVDQLYVNVDVAGELRSALPPRLAPLAGPVAGGLRQVATRTTLTLLGRPRVEQAWKEANRLTAQQFINIAEGRSGAITTRGNAVVLDLRVVLAQLVKRLGLPGRRVDQLPPNAGAVTVLRSDQVTALQDIVSGLKGLALVLPILALGLLAGAVGLAGGHRRRTLMWAGIDLIGAGVVVLLIRSLLGGYVVDALAGDTTVRPAAQAAWDIGTTLLRDTAQAAIIGALPLLLAAWLAGPTRLAVGARFRLAPLLREHVGASFAVLAGLLVLIVAWGPIPATHEVIPVLIMTALAMLGLYLLRQQTLEEFPPLTAEVSESAGSGSMIAPDEPPVVPAP